MLEVRQVSGGYHDNNVIDHVSFSLYNNEILGVIGPIGSGKATLLKLITKQLPLTEGEIFLSEKKLGQYSIKELANLMAVLPQSIDIALSCSVIDFVKLGRYAHQKGLFSAWSISDEKIVNEVLEMTDLIDKQNKSITELSGGEKQRVSLARALALEPKILLLDKLTNHFDISYQIKLLNSLKAWSQERGISVIATFHDLNLASMYCDKLLLMQDGKAINIDEPNYVMDVYNTNFTRKNHPNVHLRLIPFLPGLYQHKASLKELVHNSQDQYISFTSEHPFKTLSSAMIGDGFKWTSQFVNRHVDKDYSCSNPTEEMVNFLRERGIDPMKTVGMMTAANLSDASFKGHHEQSFSLSVCVTVGISNAVDASKAYFRGDLVPTPGTINIFLFIEGNLTEAAFVQAMMTVTESKVKALHNEEVYDLKSNTIATGTSTDSISIAATQTGEHFEYAGTITNLGKAIGYCVYECVVSAIKKNKKRLEEKQA